MCIVGQEHVIVLVYVSCCSSVMCKDGSIFSRRLPSFLQILGVYCIKHWFEFEFNPNSQASMNALTQKPVFNELGYILHVKLR